MEVLYGQKCRVFTAEMEIQRNSGVLNILRIWHIESMDQTHSRINPKLLSLLGRPDSSLGLNILFLQQRPNGNKTMKIKEYLLL